MQRFREPHSSLAARQAPRLAHIIDTVDKMRASPEPTEAVRTYALAELFRRRLSAMRAGPFYHLYDYASQQVRK